MQPGDKEYEAGPIFRSVDMQDNLRLPACAIVSHFVCELTDSIYELIDRILMANLTLNQVSLFPTASKPVNSWVIVH